MSNMHAHGIGNLTKDAEFQQIGESKKASFRIAVSHRFTDRVSEKQERANFFNCEIWGKPADVLEQLGALKKGARVGVLGHFRSDKYKDKDGVDREFDYIYLTEPVELLSPKAVAPDSE